MKLRLALGLGGLHLSLLSALALSSIPSPAIAQGQNKAPVEKPNRSVACPSGWSHPDGDTSLCAPMGSTAPKVYAKAADESCASGYHEVYCVWCSTRKP